MKIKELQTTFNLHSFQSNKRNVLNTGKDLVTERCPKIDFSCLLLFALSVINKA